MQKSCINLVQEVCVLDGLDSNILFRIFRGNIAVFNKLNVMHVIQCLSYTLKHATEINKFFQHQLKLTDCHNLKFHVLQSSDKWCYILKIF